jgi:hypothetical protein
VIFVVVNIEKDSVSGRGREVVSHGIEHDTGHSVVLPNVHPNEVGAEFDPRFGEYIIRDQVECA